MILRYSILSIISFLLYTPTAPAQWLRTTGPEGATVTTFLTEGNTIYAGAGDYGPSDVYKSTDLGATWTSIAPNVPGSSPVVGIALAMNKGELYVGSLGGVFKSNDGGGHWDGITPGMKGYRCTAISASDSTLIAGMSSEGIYRSTDDGKTWSPSTFDMGHPTNYHTILRAGSTLFLTTQGQGVYRSDNDGRSWTQSTDTMSGDNLYVDPIYALDGMLYVGSIRGMYRSSDNGVHWLHTTIPASEAVSFTSNGHTLYMNAGYEGVFASVDHGDSWTKIGTGLPENNLKGIAYLNGKLFVGSDRLGIFRGDIQSGTWESAMKGVNNTSVMSLQFLTTKDNVTSLYAGTLDADFGMGWKSGDQATTWKSFLTLTNRGVHAFAIQNGIMFAGTDGEGIYRSTDDGATWKPAPNQINGASYVNAFAVTPHAVLAGSSGFSTGVLRSTDGGNNWMEAQTIETFAPNVLNMFYDDKSQKTFAANSFGFAVSTDEGLNWSTSNSKLDSVECYAIVRKGNTLYVGATFGVYASSDDGVTWNVSGTQFSHSTIKSLTTSGNFIFAGSKDSVFVSTDGITWTPYLTGLPPQTDILSLATDKDYLYAGTAGFGVWKAPLPKSESVAAHAEQTGAINVTYGEQEITVHHPEMQSARLSIYKVDGSLMRTVESAGGEQTSINTSGFAPGVYYIQMRSADTMATTNFVILPH